MAKSKGRSSRLVRSHAKMPGASSLESKARLAKPATMNSTPSRQGWRNSIGKDSHSTWSSLTSQVPVTKTIATW